MTPIKQKAWIPANPNREIRRHLEREFIKLKPLLKIDKAFEEALNTDNNIEYSLILGFYRGEYKKAYDRIIKFSEINHFDINENFMEEKYGYERTTFTPYENGVQILKPIRKFINRFNNGN